MRYVQARCEEARRDRIYRIYVTDGLRIIGGLNERYVELLESKPQENRTAEEIKAHICKKLEALSAEADE